MQRPQLALRHGCLERGNKHLDALLALDLLTERKHVRDGVGLGGQESKDHARRGGVGARKLPSDVFAGAEARDGMALELSEVEIALRDATESGVDGGGGRHLSVKG